MSGWQRIGMVISVLWLVGFPIYLMIDQNSTAGKLYGECYSAAYSAYGSQPDKLKARTAECSQTHSQIVMTPEKLLRVLMGGDKESWVFWLIILTPLAAFWIVGGTMITTLRWIARGFQTGSRARENGGGTASVRTSR
jgi:hypothetical protein